MLERITKNMRDGNIENKRDIKFDKYFAVHKPIYV